MMEDTEEHRDSSMLTNEDPVVSNLLIRPARPEDAELLVNLVRELAVYEKLEQSRSGDARRHFASTCSVLSPRPRRRWPRWAANRWASRFGSARFRRSAASRGCISRTFS